MNDSNGDEVERGKIVGYGNASFSASSLSFASLRPCLISRRRILFVVFGIILFLCAYSVGSMLVKISSSEAQIIKKQFLEQIGGINGLGIFLNNIKVASAMFIPGFGIALGAFSGLSTGIVFNAVSETSGIHHNDISPLMVFLTPFGILEVIAYGIAISRSGILSYQLIRNKNKRQYWKEKYAIPTIIELSLVIVILIAAATIEWQIALQLKSLGDQLTGLH
jgi:uncharacterized membrane protein SpoIIM required for sporulation